MKYLLTLSLLLLSGCTSIQSWIPSFWDDNQSNYIIQARVDIRAIDCSQPQLVQIREVERDLTLFITYSEAKGTLQKDVIRVVEPMKSTVDEWIQRGEGSQMYCKLKKGILTQQGERASRVILGRW